MDEGKPLVAGGDGGDDGVGVGAAASADRVPVHYAAVAAAPPAARASTSSTSVGGAARGAGGREAAAVEARPRLVQWVRSHEWAPDAHREAGFRDRSLVGSM